MLLKVIHILFILSTFTFYSYGIHVSEFNETKLILTINSQLSELRAGQEKLTKELAKDLDMQFIRAELERQKNCVVVKEADSESSRADIQVLRTDIQSLRAELDNLKDEKESAIQSLRAENKVLREDLEKKCIIDKEADSQVFRADIQSLRAELEHQKKDILEKEAAIQSLRADSQVFRTELEQQKKCVLDKETDIQVFKTDIQKLKAELEQQKKHILDKEADNQILRAELERQEELKRQESDKPHNCTEAKISGIHDILVPKFSNQTFKVACDAETREGGWTIILRRKDGSVNFTRNWAEYKNGFGNLDGEYFLGLDKIHAMTAERPQELLVVLEDFEGDERFETYDDFAIGDESQQYELHTLGEASGTAGDSLRYTRGVKFTTFDKDNDNWSGRNCAIRGTGAWWYYACQDSQLTGTFKDNGYDRGVTWDAFRGPNYSLKKAIMMTRPKK